jgi:hypothetical protein
MTLWRRPNETVSQKIVSGASWFLNFLIYIPVILILFATIVRTSADYPLGRFSAPSGKLRIYQVPTPADWFLPIGQRGQPQASRKNRMIEDGAMFLYRDRG